MSLKSAFNSLLLLQSRSVTISRPGTAFSATIKIAPSNYFRNMEAPSETIIQGREFVVSKDNLDSANYPLQKRGDRMLDAEMGTLVITEVREMFDLGAQIMGYRIRVG